MSLLSLEEFNSIRASETPNDFGEDNDDLWEEAAIFEYEVATAYSDSKANTSPGYHPYIICSSHPDLSGDERQDKLDELLQNTPNISETHYYGSGNLFVNDAEGHSCGLVRAFDDTIHKLYEYWSEVDPDVTDHLKVNPLHSSMKMQQNTVAVLEKWFAGEDAGTAVTTGSTNPDTITVRTMTLQTLLCPGVQDFGGEDVPDDEITTDVQNFIMAEGGKAVADLSFYYQLVNNGVDGDNANAATDRMKQWSSAITSVMNWTQADGSNACLDRVIGDNMEFSINKKELEVKAKYSFYEAEKLADSLGFAEEDMETCIWYMAYALAVSPQICTMEPQAELRTLCKDGTSDLTKCPAPEPVAPPDNNGSSDGRGGVWWLNLLLSLGSSAIVVGFGL